MTTTVIPNAASIRTELEVLILGARRRVKASRRQECTLKPRRIGLYDVVASIQYIDSAKFPHFTTTLRVNGKKYGLNNLVHILNGTTKI
jgi:hypothetical protein